MPYIIYNVEKHKDTGFAMAHQKMEKPQEPLEKQFWAVTDKLRKNIDAAEYKHVVLGLIFLRYISDSFEELYEKA